MSPTSPPDAPGLAAPARLAPEEGHRRWAESYDAEPNPLTALEERLVTPRLGRLEGLYVVEVGCGTGRWLAAARARGARVFGIDRSSEMLARAAAKPGLAGALALGDAAALPVRDGAADVVLCAFCAAYAGPLEPLLAELARAARRGGAVWLTDLHPDAAALGWTRGGAGFDIAAAAYTTAALLAAARRAGLVLEELLEARFGEPERPIFRRAGREERFAESRTVPALLAVGWHRP